MATTSETLTYEFASKGLRDLRRSMSGLETDLTGVADAADKMADRYRSAVDQLIKDTQRLEDAAKGSGGAMQEVLQGSTAEAAAVAEALKAARTEAGKLDGSKIQVEVAGGGGGGGAIGGALAGGASLAQLAFFATRLGEVSEAITAARDIAESAKTATRNVNSFVDGLEKGARAPKRFNDALNDGQEGLEGLGEKAQWTKERIVEMYRTMRGQGPAAPVPDFDNMPSVNNSLDDLKSDYRSQATASPQEVFGAFDIDAAGDSFDAFGFRMGANLRDINSEMSKVGDAAQKAGDTLNTFKVAGEKVGRAWTGANEQMSAAGEYIEDITGLSPAAASKVGLIASAATIAAAKLAQLTLQVSQYAQQLRVAATQSGGSAEAIQSVFLQAQRLDSQVDLDTVRDGMKELALRTTEAIENGGEAKEAFERLGIGMDQLREISGDTGAVFDLVQTKMRGLTDQQRALTLEQTFGGEAGERFARLMSLSAAEVADLRREVDDLILSTEQLKDLDEVASEWTALGQTWDAVGNKLAVLGTDQVQASLELLNRISRAILAIVDAGVWFNQQVDAMHDQLDELLGPLRFLSASSLPEFVNEVIEAGDALWAWVAGVESAKDASDDLADTDSAGLGFDTAETGKQIQELITTFANDKAALQDDLQRGLIGKEEYLTDLIELRKGMFEELRRINLETPGLDLSGLVDTMYDRYTGAKDRLEKLLEDDPVTAPVVFELDPDADLEDIYKDLIDAQAEQAKERQRQRELYSPDMVGQSAEELESMEAALKRAQNSFQQMRADAKKALLEVFDGAESAEEALESMVKSLSGAALNPLIDQLGNAVNPFKSLRGNSQRVDALRLNREQIQQDLRILRQSLKEREISYTEYQLRVKQLNQQLAGVNRQLAEETESVWRKSLESIAGIVEQTMEAVIAKISQAIMQALILKAIGFAFGGPTAGSSVGQLFGSALGVTSSTSQPGVRSGGSSAITMQGETRIDKGDIIVSYNSGQRANNRYGGSSSRVS